ncbi:MAG: NrfD/PsrC family molybdoenzyme membrane anchor subunit [Deltaproteobacteria bacterium]|nr:NrfD/PsrC family molybdoenzyme membrane anchor subunit [Deltaproteobacteria bacterium]
MDTSVLYNVFPQETFGTLIAIYFYLTGLSAGSFVLSTLAYVFGMEKYKPIGKIGVILAALFLVMAPLALLVHVGQPFKAWHLFVYLNVTSPITWGSFLLTLYPINCLIYGWFMFKGNSKMTRLFGTIGIPLAVFVHGYTGFILALGKARALWNTALMPFLFLVSAMVSGIALMILISLVKDRFFSQEKAVNRDLIFGLGNMLAAMILIDLFLVLSDVLVLLVSHAEAQEVAHLLLKGKFSIYFIWVENVIGKILPAIILLIPRLRNLTTVTLASILVVIGIFFMRYVVVLGGEFLPLV